MVGRPLSLVWCIICFTGALLISLQLLGQNNQAGKSILKTDYTENNTIDQNLKIAVKILIKTMDSTTPSPERIELSVMQKEEDGTLSHRMLTPAEVVIFRFLSSFHLDKLLGSFNTSTGVGSDRGDSERGRGRAEESGSHHC